MAKNHLDGVSPKERIKQLDALKSISHGEAPEKRIMVGYKGAEKERGDIEGPLTKIMQDVRMPLFCKKCDKLMKKRLDDKMWGLYNHCFNCQLQFEHKLRLEGKYDEWEKEKVKQNKISFVKENIEKIKEWKTQSTPGWYNNVGVNYPELEKEKWNIDRATIQKDADAALEKYTEVLNELENTE
jgi:ribosomal protein L37AE/L43A